MVSPFIFFFFPFFFFLLLFFCFSNKHLCPCFWCVVGTEDELVGEGIHFAK